MVGGLQEWMSNTIHLRPRSYSMSPGAQQSISRSTGFSVIHKVRTGATRAMEHAWDPSIGHSDLDMEPAPRHSHRWLDEQNTAHSGAVHSHKGEQKQAI